MPRKKKYIESEVIEKAMQLFWHNGYETTSIRELEKEMGINQFSIYSSFGNKKGVFLKSLSCYKEKVKKELIDKLKNSVDGVDAIKQYFYDFIAFSRDAKGKKGCLITNTVNELGENADKEILNSVLNFAANVKTLFIEKLELDTSKTKKIIEKQSNYLMVALQGVSVASKMFSDEQLTDFIESTFERL